MDGIVPPMRNEAMSVGHKRCALIAESMRCSIYSRFVKVSQSFADNRLC